MRNAKGWLVSYGTSTGEQALLFCSKDCEHNALEDGERTGQTVRLSPTLAKAVTCYGCGLSLWEANNA